MIRVILIFAVGLGLGYWVGFKDAKTHKQDIVARTVARVGGQTRQDVSGDFDKKTQAVVEGVDR
jgi:hypothetical protein